jgi:hypothetical protein
MLKHNVKRYGGGSRRCIGLTSPANLEFCRSLGVYDQVCVYGELEAELDNANQSVVLVDMAGNGQLVERFHRHFGERNKYTCAVGNTHWDRPGASAALPAPKPVFFFAPGHIAERGAAAKELPAVLARAWLDFATECRAEGWLNIARGAGADAVAQVYHAHLQGSGASPDTGFVLSMHESDASRL